MSSILALMIFCGIEPKHPYGLETKNNALSGIVVRNWHVRTSNSMETLLGIGFSILAIILFTLAWKLFKCPKALWEELQRTPYNKSYDIIQRILK